MSKFNRIIGFMMIFTVVMVFSVATCLAAEKFPNRPITCVAQWSAGGGTDITARTLAPALEKQLGVRVNVINKTGASGSIAHKYVLGSKPDGYTMGTFCPTITVYKAGKVCELVPSHYNMIAMVTRWSPLIGVRTDSKWKNAQDYINYAKKNPNLVTCGSCGVWTTYSVAEYLLGMTSGTKIRHVTTECTAMTIPLVVGGHIDSGIIGGPEMLPHFKAGKLRPLVATTAERSPLFPNVPTVRELGYDYEFPTFIAFFMPKGVPAERKRIIVDAFKKAAESDAFTNTVTKMGMQRVWVGPDELTALLASLQSYVDKVAAWKAGK